MLGARLVVDAAVGLGFAFLFYGNFICHLMPVCREPYIWFPFALLALQVGGWVLIRLASYRIAKGASTIWPSALLIALLALIQAVLFSALDFLRFFAFDMPTIFSLSEVYLSAALLPQLLAYGVATSAIVAIDLTARSRMAHPEEVF